MLTLSSPDPWM